MRPRLLALLALFFVVNTGYIFAFARLHFFKAMVQKADGDYDGAAASLEHVLQPYPRDRVVWNQLGRIRFLQRKYADSIAALQKALEVEPEDLQAHYTLMLAYRGAGDTEKAGREEKLFQRFKADEAPAGHYRPAEIAERRGQHRKAADPRS